MWFSSPAKAPSLHKLKNPARSGNEFEVCIEEVTPYQPGIGPGRVKPDLIEGFLVPGTEVRGWVTFQLPEGLKLGRAQFFQGYISGNPVDFSLEGAQ